MTDQATQDPPQRVRAPKWLSPKDVADWLHFNWTPPGTQAGTEPLDQTLIRNSCAAAEPYVARCRPEFATADGYTPDDEAYQGAVMYAARLYRRRNSPAGVEVYGEGTSFVSRFDPDIDRCLRTGAWAPPVTA